MKLQKNLYIAILLLLGHSAASHAEVNDRVLPLAGQWHFMRGGPQLAQHLGALPELKFEDSITLPGTTDTNEKGTASRDKSTYSFTQPYQYTGTCWYERDFTAPGSWTEKRVTLMLERTKYTQVWLDGQPVGENAICCTPQEYQISSALAAGNHKLTIAVNNQRIPPVGADSHQFSGNTQGNWNGIIGKIELRMTDQIWIEDAQIFPDSTSRKVTVKLRITNSTPIISKGTLNLNVSGKGVILNASASAEVALPPGGTSTQVQLPLGPEAALWSELHPALHRLTVRLTADGSQDSRTITFGVRNFLASGQQFTNNGKVIFLRGKHDACVFPLTGHPPMDVTGWLHYLRICQSYGLNHIRFHTWTPPDAAFEAADQLGFYLQPELPFWGAFTQDVKDKLEPEAEHILAALGNHPSFVMFSMGNEHWADQEVLASLVGELKALDSRHLFVRGSSAFSYLGRPGKGDDYLISGGIKTDPNGPLLKIRGSNGGTPDAQGHVQTGPANTMTDYSAAIAGTTWPTVTHEMGQYTVFPDFRQLAKYTGVSKAYNLEHIKDNLAKAGMSDQADDFARASGALAALCYREEIESCLRTPHYGGFELLDLQDYPGQGTALVGMLDSCMDSKGIITPEQWQQFCAPIVLLATFPKYIWTSGQTLIADIHLAQYGEADLSAAVVKWTLTDSSGKPLARGSFPPIDATHGALRSIGHLALPLDKVVAPAEVRLELSLDPHIKTSYALWVYPTGPLPNPPATVKISRWFDRTTEESLAKGNRVLLICDSRHSLIESVGGGFASDFWNFTFFHNKPGTMGLLCESASPALSMFPTESHSNWQWFDVTMNSQPLILDTLLPRGEHPIVQVIDNYERCHKLGLVFEVKVGPGRLLVCMADLQALLSTHPEARQLLASLQQYAASDQFNPHTTVPAASLRDLFRTSIPTTGCKVTASSYDHGWQGYAPNQLIDGNDAKAWKADENATGDSWCKIQFPGPVTFNGGEILWTESESGYQYIVESSTDGLSWKLISDQRKNSFHEARHRIAMESRNIQFVRITIFNTPGHRPAGINEVRFYPAEIK